MSPLLGSAWALPPPGSEKVGPSRLSPGSHACRPWLQGASALSTLSTTPEGHEGALLSTVQLSPAFSSLCQGAPDITVPPHGPVCSLRATEDFRPPAPRAIEWPSPAPPEFTTHNTRCRNKMIVSGRVVSGRFVTQRWVTGLRGAITFIRNTLTINMHDDVKGPIRQARLCRPNGAGNGRV